MIRIGNGIWYSTKNKSDCIFIQKEYAITILGINILLNYAKVVIYEAKCYHFKL